MLVPSMSWEEVYYEIIKDAEESDIARRAAKRIYLDTNKYKRIYGDRNGLYAFNTFTIKSNRNNKFYIIPIINDKRDFKRCGLTMSICLFFRNDKGNWIISFNPNSYIEVISKHLIDRHKVRFKEEEYEGETFQRYAMEFIVKNFICCPVPQFKNTKEKYGENAIYARCADGILVGHELTRNLYVYSTYLSDDLLYDNQKCLSIKMENLRRKSEENFNHTINEPSNIALNRMCLSYFKNKK